MAFQRAVHPSTMVKKRSPLKILRLKTLIPRWLSREQVRWSFLSRAPYHPLKLFLVSLPLKLRNTSYIYSGGEEEGDERLLKRYSLQAGGSHENPCSNKLVLAVVHAQ
uniref:Uncharacterized protein n=1 Tax=Salix viminalis TaxID=40686 RepID=A0A6N2L1K3_SALVM